MTSRHDFERLAQRGPHRDPADVLAAVLESTSPPNLKETHMPSPAFSLDLSPAPAVGQRRMIASAAVVVALMLGVGAASMMVGTDEGAQTTAGADRGSGSSLTPTATLPVTDDLMAVPMTVPDDSLSWYRMAPDLDLAWNSSSEGEPQLCWRTPVERGCQPDTVPSDGRFVALPTAGGQTLVVMWAPSGVARPTDAIITFSDGTTQEAPVAWGDDLWVGVVRLRLQGDAVIEDVS